MNITAIETEYKGYKFRSRLEARWAVFFDTLGVKWEYEPEGFTLPDGKHYLPDFRVRCYGTRGDYDREPFDLYIEVKGVMRKDDASKIWGFAKFNPILVLGNIPDVRCPEDCVNRHVFGETDCTDLSPRPFNYEVMDGDNYMAYPAVHDGKFYLMGDDYVNNEDLQTVYAAYIAAKQARFEHRKTGADAWLGNALAINDFLDSHPLLARIYEFEFDAIHAENMRKLWYDAYRDLVPWDISPVEVPDDIKPVVRAFIKKALEEAGITDLREVKKHEAE